MINSATPTENQKNIGAQNVRNPEASIARPLQIRQSWAQMSITGRHNEPVLANGQENQVAMDRHDPGSDSNHIDDSEPAEKTNPTLAAAVERIQERAKEAHASHYTKHSSHSTKHSTGPLW